MTKRRKRSLAGTNLYYDERCEAYYWRKVDPRTGRRLVRSTQQRRLDLASRVAARFEDELRQELAGLKSHDQWKVDLEPLALEWIADQEGGPRPKTLRQKRREVLRALRDLDLRKAADLDDVAALDRRLRAMVRRGQITASTAARSYQRVLKQFSGWLAGNNLYLSRNPLTTWVPIDRKKLRSRPGVERRRVKRQPFMPDSVARALAALEVLDDHNRRENPTRMLFMALLVTTPRLDALLSRDAKHFDGKRMRIEFGAGNGHKNTGAGALDSRTATELEAYLAGREDGPLLLSPKGVRWIQGRVVQVWREAFGLGVLDELWPRDVEPDLSLAILVNRALLTGNVMVSKGGNPQRVTEDTLAERRALRTQVEALVKRLRADWTERAAVDVHSFRHTHRTWAEASGVAPALIDKQLGHAGGREQRTLDIYKAIQGSVTGRRHYLDLNSKLFDPQQSANAVRELLDKAEGALRAAGTPLLFPGEESPSRAACQLG